MFSIALCEDNKIEAAEIATFIETCKKDNCNLHMFYSKSELQQYMQQTHCTFQIMILDICLNDGSGIEIAQDITRNLPYTQIIFLTNYLEYATEVYEVPHLYLIHKPKLKQYLPKALEKAVIYLNDLNQQFLHITYQKEFYQIPIREIRYMERTLRTTKIYTRNSVYQTSENFTKLLERLPDSFVICQRSYMINLYYVTKLNRNEVLLENKIRISVGKNYNELKERFALHITGNLHS